MVSSLEGSFQRCFVGISGLGRSHLAVSSQVLSIIDCSAI